MRSDKDMKTLKHQSPEKKLSINPYLIGIFLSIFLYIIFKLFFN